MFARRLGHGMAVLTAIALSTIATAHAGETSRGFSVETDPATFALGGYAAHLRFAPAITHWVFGVGAYSLELPDIMVDMNKRNRDRGWEVELRQGLGVFGEYYLAETNRGWFLGGQVARHAMRIANPSAAPTREAFVNALLMIHAGYRWFPMHSGLYLQPWMGVGYVNKISGTTRIGDKDYDISPIMPFATLHVGYQF